MLKDIQEISCKSILVKSKLPDADYVVNPYVGCSFGCVYCYASFMSRFVDKKAEDWGNFVFVKQNAAEIFATDIKKLQQKKPKARIFLSSVTDPYQTAEKKYELTRLILREIAASRYEGLISILTKSPLVLRDLDILTAIPHLEVGLTITSADDKASKYLEINAPSVTSRLHTLTQLNQRGIKTYAFIGPLLPHIMASPGAVKTLFMKLAATGTKSLYIERLNTSPYIFKQLVRFINTHDSQYRAFYAGSEKKAEEEMQISQILEAAAQFDFDLRLGGIIRHPH